MAQRGAAVGAALRRAVPGRLGESFESDGSLSSASDVHETDELPAARHYRLVREEEVLCKKLEDLEKLWQKRRGKLTKELEEAERRRLDEQRVLDSLLSDPEDNIGDPVPTPPGPQALRWVDGACYSCTCSAVIAANLGTMAYAAREPDEKARFAPLDHAFLVWYVLELVLKTVLHQRGLFLGPLSEIWWNWLDLLIVASGVVEQWLLPGLEHAAILPYSDHQVSFSALRSLRLLRLFRIVRVVKIGKVFVNSDLSWTEGNAFQSFIMAVIALNTLLLGVELDVPWDGWHWVEQVFLLIYVFEIAVRIKRWKLVFFYHDKDVGWNVMDFVIVWAAVLDQWLMPAVQFVNVVIFKEPIHRGSSTTEVVMLLRIMRLFRILRLVRLLRAVKPLFRLLMGILEAMQAMLWVLALTVIILYACAILVTSLIGHGIIFNGEIPEEAEGLFSTVPQSMFLLFKLMNDDQSVMDPILWSKPARIFFVCFMVLTNWAILAVLTSVMSESMISATHRNNAADEKEQQHSDKQRRIYRLKNLFTDLDKSGDGFVDEGEFSALLEDETLASELFDVSGLSKRDLNELFDFLCDEDHSGKRRIRYVDFVHNLQIEGEAVVERSLFRLEKEARKLERRLSVHIERRLDVVVSHLARTRFQVKQGDGAQDVSKVAASSDPDSDDLMARTMPSVSRPRHIAYL